MQYLLANFAKEKSISKNIDFRNRYRYSSNSYSRKKLKQSKIIGVEIQEEVCEMATRSVKLNDLEDRVEIVNADIKEIDKILEIKWYTM